MTNKVYADGKGPTYTYTPDGKLSQRIWARGIATDYTYDGWGNLTNTVYSDDTPTVSLKYDVLGRQIEAHDAAGVTAFLYDSYGSLTNETVIGVAGTNTIIRYWDEFGRTAGYALNGTRQTSIDYEPDKGRISTMGIENIHSTTTTNHYNSFSWTYLPGSDLKSSLVYPNGLTASWQYDSVGHLLQVCNTTSTNVISQYDYTYDPAGRRVVIGRSGSAMSETRTDEYGYNIRGELISAAKNAEDAKVIEYQYAYDDIGNRISSYDIGTNRIYTANNLNQYTQISNLCDSASLREEFIPQFDDDGNQTLIKTATGIWQVTYNGENRPILWECLSTNSPTYNSSTPPLITMSYDRMGRRVTKKNLRFVYNGYLQIADSNGNAYIWVPTALVATRPLVWNHENYVFYYAHDSNKNVSEVVSERGCIVEHYKYIPFGVAFIQRGSFFASNPWRFSSEYVEDDTAMVYYNYRYYDLEMGRWVQRDLIYELGGVSLYVFVKNCSMSYIDYLGLKKWNNRNGKGCDFHEIDKSAIAAMISGIKKMNYDKGRMEYFGSICCKCEKGKYVSFFTGPFRGRKRISKSRCGNFECKTVVKYSPLTEEFAKCPSGSVLVGYYHTHPDGHSFSRGDFEFVKGRDVSLYMGHADTVDDNGIYMRLDPWRTDNPIDAGIKCKDIFMPNGIPIQPRPVNLNFSIYN